MVKAKRNMQNAMNAKKAPAGVKIISVLYYIGAVLSVLAGILIIVVSDYMASLVPELGTLGSGLFIFVGIILLIFGVLGFFIGKGLWNLKSWARIVAIIFAIFGIISAIYSILGEFAVRHIVSIVIHAVMGGYLFFSKDVKRAFA